MLRKHHDRSPRILSAHFPSIGSDDPLGVENVKIRENSEKNQRPSGGHLESPSTTLLRPLKEGSRPTHICENSGKF